MWHQQHGQNNVCSLNNVHLSSVTHRFPEKSLSEQVFSQVKKKSATFSIFNLFFTDCRLFMVLPPVFVMRTCVSKLSEGPEKVNCILVTLLIKTIRRKSNWFCHQLIAVKRIYREFWTSFAGITMIICGLLFPKESFANQPIQLRHSPKPLIVLCYKQLKKSIN